MRRELASRLWQGTLLAVLVLTTYLLLAPSPPTPPGPSGIADKGAHLAMFALLGVLGGKASARPRWHVWVGLVLYGAAAEILQSLVGREPSVLDAAADAIGAAVVWLVPAPRHGPR